MTSFRLLRFGMTWAKQVVFIRHAHAAHNAAQEEAERGVVSMWERRFRALADVKRDEGVPGWSLAILHELEKTETADQVKELARQRKEMLFAALNGPGMVDPGLSVKGFGQLEQLRPIARNLVEQDKIEVVLSSSLRRTLQTAQVFHGVAPIVALDELREIAGAFDCERRRALQEITQEFPSVDSSACSSHDEMWSKHYRDALDRAVQFRSVQALQAIMNRPEQKIAVVSHGMFLASGIFQNGERIRSFGAPPRLNCQVVPARVVKHADGTFEVHAYNSSL